MGTSSSNYGPSGNTPLLPDWNEANPTGNGPENPNDTSPPDNDTNPQNNPDNNSPQENDAIPQSKPNNNPVPLTGNWSGAKRSLGNFTKNPTRTNFNRAARSYIKASGGAKNISQSAHFGKISGGNIITFLNDVRQNGIGATSENMGLGDVTEQSIEQLFNNLADSLSSGGGTDEETFARNAVIEALGKIYEDFDLENNSPEVLDQITEDQSIQYLEYYLSSYVFERWLHELGVKMEEKDINATELVSAEDEAYGFIQSSINLKVDEYNLTRFNYNTSLGKEIMDKVYIQAYTIIEEL